MFKCSKWAKQVLSLQRDDGSWGYFHSMSEPRKYPFTTEQALRRLAVLGFTIEDEPIKKAVAYLHDCLTGRNEMPDRKEKLHDWNIFTKLMAAAWIRIFTREDPAANAVAETWADVISRAFSSGKYDHNDYLAAYQRTFKKQARGGRLVDFVHFYIVSLVSDCLDLKTERAVFDHILCHETGIYYIYPKPLSKLPETFMSKTASLYIGAVELLTDYRRCTDKLIFVADWLNGNKINGKWDMGSEANDRIYFPLSDSWRSKDTRADDCTFRIEKLLERINSK